MCDFTRRNLLLGAGAVTGLAPDGAHGQPNQTPSADAINKVDPVAAGVYFHQGDIEHQGHRNNGWIIFEDDVLVIGANFPSGAHDLLPRIGALTPQPIRFAFDTHHDRDAVVWLPNVRMLFTGGACVNGACNLGHTSVLGNRSVEVRGAAQ